MEQFFQPLVLLNELLQLRVIALCAVLRLLKAKLELGLPYPALGQHLLTSSSRLITWACTWPS